MARYPRLLPTLTTRQSSGAVAMLLAVIVAVGCGEREAIRHYRVPKTELVYARNHVDRSPGAAPMVRYELPVGWSVREPERFSQLTLGLDKGGRSVRITVSQLHGDGGGVLPNINRWYEQAGLPAISEAEMAERTEPLVLDNVSGIYVDAWDPAGEGDGMGISGWIGLQEDRSWFVKIAGDASLVREQRETFRRFLQTLKLNAS